MNNQFKNFEENFERYAANNDQLVEFLVNNPAHYPNKQPEQAYFCNINIVASIVKNLPNKIFSGLDEIPFNIIKNLPMNILRDLTIIFNNSFNNRYYPKIWKIAKVLPISKNGKDPTELKSYRPISLNANMSKIFEVIRLNAI